MIGTMRILLWVGLIAVSQTLWARGLSTKDVIGSWEGESKCMVPDSPCHDEHVLFQITSDRADPFLLKLDAYKVVDGNPDFMGTLACTLHSSVSAMSCTGDTSEKDDWEFQITGDSMSGRLTVGATRTLYRRLLLHKSAATAK